MIENGAVMMSDSLHGMVPELESRIEDYEDSFVVAVLECFDIEDGDSPLVGNLVGLALEDVIKIDMRLKLSTAHRLMSRLALGEDITCPAYQFHLGPAVTRIVGPFSLRSPRMLDVDYNNRTCTFAVDLVKISE